METLFSGIQPSGILHIGNYLGAIKQWVELQTQYRSFFCIVDEHAITVPQKPEELRENTLRTAMWYLACGIDPKKATIFVQSHVPAHTELGWILNTLTPLGELERMTQFKDKSGGRRGGLLSPNGGGLLSPGAEKDKSVFSGLLNYPTLMAADILLYKTNIVPVGEDQVQHIELARSLAERFNNRFGEAFTIPKSHLNKTAARIMGLDDPQVKMSKSAASANNYIALSDTPEIIRKKIKSAVTDSGSEIKANENSKPAITNLLSIYSLFSGKTIRTIEEKYANNATYAPFKEDLAEVVVDALSPIQKRFQELEENRDEVMKILEKGAEAAREVADKTLREVKEKVGFLIPSPQ